jgi:hypothetical protein
MAKLLGRGSRQDHHPSILQTFSAGFGDNQNLGGQVKSGGHIIFMQWN